MYLSEYTAAATSGRRGAEERYHIPNISSKPTSWLKQLCNSSPSSKIWFCELLNMKHQCWKQVKLPHCWVYGLCFPSWQSPADIEKKNSLPAFLWNPSVMPFGEHNQLPIDSRFSRTVVIVIRTPRSSSHTIQLMSCHEIYIKFDSDIEENHFK